ncbi:DMT family transporter [Streptomyces sp. NBC_00102]|uniref:DMT family transporter n=1 Tax=Streptomyces sp. NBC_00102 TaxID=2975652 RepID=UPI00224ECBA6|nr:DMT family transporter [Streptomyces sp. NBC_00102]MCX5395966.1 DMT family transporter [Streptomyces sp. NBC_00102]
MRDNDSATPFVTIALAPSATPTPAPATSGAPAGPAAPLSPSSERSGFVLASLGVLAFSLTFPATVWGLESFGPWSLVALRSVLAALIAGSVLLAARIPWPGRRHLGGLLVVAGGVVAGFPLLTTLALRTTTSSHSAVVVGLLPLTTAVFSSLRTGNRPPRAFWIAALAGAAVVLAFTVAQSGGAVSAGDLYLFGSLVVCAAGYAEGGRLARIMPGWQVIGWALLLSLPVAVAGSAVALSYEPVTPAWHGIAGLVWLAAGSTFTGLYVWYRGMAEIGIPRASQLQLAQPLLTLVWSFLLLGEDLSAAAPVAAVAVLVCIAVTQRAGTRRPRESRAPRS